MTLDNNQPAAPLEAFLTGAEANPRWIKSWSNMLRAIVNYPENVELAKEQVAQMKAALSPDGEAKCTFTCFACKEMAEMQADAPITEPACKGHTHGNCSYLAGCGTVCNKCGQLVIEDDCKFQPINAGEGNDDS